MKIAPRFTGVTQFERCLRGGRMTVDGFDSDGDLRVDAPNDAHAVRVVQTALKDLGYGLSVTGTYDRATAEVVRRFKEDEELAVPAGMSRHDGVLGPGSSGRLNALYLDPPHPHVVEEPVPAPPLEPWRHLIGFRSPAPMQAALNARFGFFGTPARVVHALEDARGPISLDHYPVRVEALPTDGTSTMTPEQLLETVRRNVNTFVDGPPNGCVFQPYDPAIDTAAWLPPFLPTAFPGAVLSIDMFTAGVNVEDGAVVLSDIGPEHWTFSTLWTPGDGGHPVSGNRWFGFVRASAGEHVFATRGADRTTTVVDEAAVATVFGAAHRLWLSFQRRLAAFVNGNGGRAHVETPHAARYDWPTVRAEYHRPTTPWTP